MTIYDIFGTIGASLFILAYLGTQTGHLRADDPRFPLVNLIGAILILVSLMADWNLPSVIMEVFWILISIYGLFRVRRAMH